MTIKNNHRRNIKNKPYKKQRHPIKQNRYKNNIRIKPQNLKLQH